MNEILLAIIAILGSTSAWQYYEKRQAEKKEDRDWIKSNYESRLVKLEEALASSHIEKTRLREQVLELTRELSKLQVKVHFLEAERDKLLNNS